VDQNFLNVLILRLNRDGKQDQVVLSNKPEPKLPIGQQIQEAEMAPKKVYKPSEDSRSFLQVEPKEEIAEDVEKTEDCINQDGTHICHDMEETVYESEAEEQIGTTFYNNQLIHFKRWTIQI
jgi:hypothetical protein